MDAPWSMVALLAAAVALLCALAGSIRVGSADINDKIFLQVLLKLCTAGNFSRMGKLCLAAGPLIPCALGVRRLCQHCTEQAPRSSQGDYRDASGDPIEPVRSELRALYEESTTEPLQRLTWAPILWAAAAVAVLGASVLQSPLAPHPQVSWWYTIVLAAALLISLWGVKTLQHVHGGTTRVLNGVLEPLARAWHAGKFQEPEPPAPPIAPVPTGPSGPSLEGHLRFEVHEPGSSTRTVELPRTPILKIGRHDRSHLRLNHPSVARMHAVLEDLGDHWMVIDLGAREGTVLNGSQVNKAEFHPGDTLLLGEVVVRLLGGQTAE